VASLQKFSNEELHDLDHANSGCDVRLKPHNPMSNIAGHTSRVNFEMEYAALQSDVDGDEGEDLIKLVFTNIRKVRPSRWAMPRAKRRARPRARNTILSL